MNTNTNENQTRLDELILNWNSSLKFNRHISKRYTVMFWPKDTTEIKIRFRVCTSRLCTWSARATFSCKEEPKSSAESANIRKHNRYLSITHRYGKKWTDFRVWWEKCCSLKCDVASYARADRVPGVQWHICLVEVAYSSKQQRICSGSYSC